VSNRTTIVTWEDERAVLVFDLYDEDKIVEALPTPVLVESLRSIVAAAGHPSRLTITFTGSGTATAVGFFGRKLRIRAVVVADGDLARLLEAADEICDQLTSGLATPYSSA
jgi:hypothetical protein